MNKIRQKYGEAVFRMAIAYLFQRGVDVIGRCNSEEAVKSIEQHHNEKGILTLSTEKSVFLCAKELSEIPFWDLLKYIQSSLEIDNQTVIEGKFLVIEANCSGSELGQILLSSDVDLDALDEAQKTFDKRLNSIQEFADCDAIDYVGLAEGALKDVGIEPKTIPADFTWIA